MVLFRSTNRQAPEVSFKAALLKGQAPDYGLYVPVLIPKISNEKIKEFGNMPYYGIAFEIMKGYVSEEEIPADVLYQLCKQAYNFPVPNLYKGENRYNLSYSGLKTAAIYQVEQFYVDGHDKSPENLAASFEKAAVDLLASKLIKACKDTGISTIVAGGGVAANSYLRQCFSSQPELKVVFPPLALCGDNAAMVAGIGCKMLERGDRDSLSLNASPRVYSFKKPSLKTRTNRNN